MISGGLSNYLMQITSLNTAIYLASFRKQAKLTFVNIVDITTTLIKPGGFVNGKCESEGNRGFFFPFTLTFTFTFTSCSFLLISQQTINF